MKGDSRFTVQYWDDAYGIQGNSGPETYEFGYLGVGLPIREESLPAIPKTKGIRFRLRGDGKKYKVDFQLPSLVKKYNWHYAMSNPPRLEGSQDPLQGSEAG